MYIKVKHAWSSALKDKDYFFDIPRNVKDAEAAGYKPIMRPVEHGLDVSMHCFEEDVRVCPLYDRNGYIAGMQIAVSITFHKYCRYFLKKIIDLIIHM